MNILMPAHPGSCSSSSRLLDVLRRRADKEGDVGPHAALGAAALVGEIDDTDRRRLGVRHLEDGGDAAHCRRGGAGAEIFLVFEAGLAEMHLGVDDTGQDVQALTRNRFRRGRADEVADRRRCGLAWTPMSAPTVPPGVTQVPPMNRRSNASVIVQLFARLFYARRERRRPRRGRQRRAASAGRAAGRPGTPEARGRP